MNPKKISLNAHFAAPVGDALTSYSHFARLAAGSAGPVAAVVVRDFASNARFTRLAAAQRILVRSCKSPLQARITPVACGSGYSVAQLNRRRPSCDPRRCNGTWRAVSRRAIIVGPIGEPRSPGEAAKRSGSDDSVEESEPCPGGPLHPTRGAGSGRKVP